MLFASDWSGWAEAMLLGFGIILLSTAVLLGLVTSAVLAFTRKHRIHWWLLPVYVLIWLILIPAVFFAFAG